MSFGTEPRPIKGCVCDNLKTSQKYDFWDILKQSGTNRRYGASDYCEPPPLAGRADGAPYSTVTDFARLRGWSTSHPRSSAMERANSCNGTLAVMGVKQSRTFGM